MRNCTAVCKKLFFLLLLAFSYCSGLFAADFYWENPEVITNTDSRFPVTIAAPDGKSTYLFWQEVDVNARQIYLSARSYTSLKEYTETRRFAGPFDYSGDEVPDIYTAAVLKKGSVGVAVMTGLSNLAVYVSSDGCKNFTETKLPATSSITVAPRIYATGSDTFRIFTSVGEENSFSIFTAESSDGIKWPRFTQFQPAANYRNPFIPVLLHSSFGDIVVFQAQYTSAETNRLSYQIYMTLDASSNGRSWSQPVLVTDRNSLQGRGGKQFYEYQNQRPVLYEYEGLVYMAWERTDTVNSSIWIENITANGVSAGSAEKVSDNGNASRPVFFEYDHSLYMTWFDTRRGRESIYMVKKDGSYWNETKLVEDRNSNMFVHPLITPAVAEGSEIGGNQKILSFIWQQVNSASKNSIAILSPDKSVLPPSFTPLSYKKGKSSRSEDVRIQINFPSDSSNISGYSYTWGKDNDSIPPKQIEHFTKENVIKLKATEDGNYVLRARVADYAGNWSEPVSINYHLDLTPPQSPYISIENLDEYGFVNSNNYSMGWKDSVSDDAVEYLYKIEYMGAIPKSIAVSKKHPVRLSSDKIQEIKESLLTRYEDQLKKQRRLTRANSTATNKLTTVRYYNRPNGVYMLSVSAVDEVGNISEPTSVLYILNKFQPSTYITGVQQTKNDSGESLLSITGGGFTYDGTIKEIYIDADGKAPYDLILTAADGQFKVQSDTRISSVQLGTELDEGTYKIGLLHTDRGLYFAGNVLQISQTGTVKIEAEYIPQSRLSAQFRQYKYKVAVSLIIVFVIILIVIITVIFIAINLYQNIYEKNLTQNELHSLFTGAAMPLKDLRKNFKRLPSLKKKLIADRKSVV